MIETNFIHAQPWHSIPAAVCPLRILHLPWASPPDVNTAMARPVPIFVGSTGACCAMILETELAERKRP